MKRLIMFALFVFLGSWVLPASAQSSGYHVETFGYAAPDGSFSLNIIVEEGGDLTLDQAQSEMRNVYFDVVFSCDYKEVIGLYNNIQLNWQEKDWPNNQAGCLNVLKRIEGVDSTPTLAPIPAVFEEGRYYHLFRNQKYVGWLRGTGTAYQVWCQKLHAVDGILSEKNDWTQYGFTTMATDSSYQAPCGRVVRKVNPDNEVFDWVITKKANDQVDLTQPEWTERNITISVHTNAQSCLMYTFGNEEFLVELNGGPVASFSYGTLVGLRDYWGGYYFTVDKNGELVFYSGFYGSEPSNGVLELGIFPWDPEIFPSATDNISSDWVPGIRRGQNNDLFIIGQGLHPAKYNHMNPLTEL